MGVALVSNHRARRAAVNRVMRIPTAARGASLATPESSVAGHDRAPAGLAAGIGASAIAPPAWRRYSK